MPGSENAAAPVWPIPLIVQSGKCPYRVCYGFDALAAVGVADEPLPAYLINADAEPAEILLMAAHFHRRLGGFSPLEISRMILALDALKVSAGQNRKVVEAVTHLPMTPAMCLALRGVQQLPQPVTAFLTERRASLKTWCYWATDALALMPFAGLLLAKTRPTLSLAEELIVYLVEIARRDARPPETVIAELNLAGLLETATAPAAKLALLRQTVRQARLPRLSKRLAVIEQLRSKIQLPAAVRLLTDPDLEEKVIRLNVELRRPADLQCLKALGSDELINRLAQLLDAV